MLYDVFKRYDVVTQLYRKMNLQRLKFPTVSITICKTLNVISGLTLQYRHEIKWFKK